MYILTSLFCVLAIALTLFKRGRAAAMCAAWGFVFLCPAWMEREFGAFKLTPRIIAVTVAVGSLFVFSDKWKLNKRLVLLDLLVILIAVTEMTTMYFSKELTVTMVAYGVGTWCVPYLLGRLITSSPGNEGQVVSVAVIVVSLLTLWGVAEAVLQINPVNFALGRRDYGGSFRWGLRRAEGPLQHPIHFGNMMLMLFPWTMEAARRSLKGIGPSWWRLAPAIGFLGVFTSLSRGPILGAIIATACMVYLKMPRYRPLIVAGGLASIAFLFVNAAGFMDALQQSTGEEQEWGSYVVAINGEEYEYTGTNHRLLQFLVFKPALQDAGFFGYGTWGNKPSHIASIAPGLRQKFWSIDNHYILMTLRCGYVGLLMFFAVGATALCYSLRLGLFGGEDSMIASGMCGVIVASLIILWSVWFSPDFSFVWLTSIGLVAGWWAKNLNRTQLLEVRTADKNLEPS